MQTAIILRSGRPSKSDTYGFIAGTNLLTMDGERPVDHLCIGDRIVTRDKGMAVLTGTKATDVTMPTIRIKPGSLGHTRPDRHAEVLPKSRILIRDWRAAALFGMKDALVPAQRLIDGCFVAAQPARLLRVFTLQFDADHILYADGLELSTA